MECVNEWVVDCEWWSGLKEWLMDVISIVDYKLMWLMDTMVLK